MKRILLLLTVVAVVLAMSVAAAGPAFAWGSSPPPNCPKGLVGPPGHKFCPPGHTFLPPGWTK